MSDVDTDVIDTRTAAVLLHQIVAEGPVATSTEGLDDCCFFCGADAQWEWDRDGRWGYSGPFAIHEYDCPWVLGRVLFGLGLGRDERKPA